jgi:hypothetical protein
MNLLHDFHIEWLRERERETRFSNFCCVLADKGRGVVELIPKTATKRFLIVYHGGTLIYIDKKENKIFLIDKEIQKGAVAKPYMINGLLIHI